MPGSLCQHEDFIHTIGLMVDQLLSIWTLLLLFAFSVVLQIIMNIIFLTIAISVIYPVITIINMIFVTSQHQDWSLTTSWWLSDFSDTFQYQQRPHCHIYASASVSHSLTDCPLVTNIIWLLIFFRGEYFLGVTIFRGEYFSVVNIFHLFTHSLNFLSLTKFT